MRRVLLQMRASIIMGFLLYASFGLLDWWIVPNFMYEIWFIRYAIVCPVIAAFFVYTYYANTEQQLEISYSTALLVGGFGLITITWYAAQGGNIHYWNGLLLYIFYAYIFTGIRFCYAVVCSWLVTIGYAIVSLYFDTLPGSILLNNISFLLAANIIGMFGSHTMERYIRKSFLYERQMNLDKIKLTDVNHRLEQLSFVDGLTGIGNRRAFHVALEREWNRGKREQSHLSLLFIDIDFFKRYNDHLGHLAGDECLKRVAETMQQSARRPADLLARYGGEEFLLLLPETGANEATGIAEHIRKNVENLNIPNPGLPQNGNITVSVGLCSTVVDEGFSETDLIETADKALYEAKRLGKNCVAECSFPDDSTLESSNQQ